jgi:hypothetical protein
LRNIPTQPTSIPSFKIVLEALFAWLPRCAVAKNIQEMKNAGVNEKAPIRDPRFSLPRILHPFIPSK